MTNSLYTSTHAIRSLKAKFKARRTVPEKIADLMTKHFGTTTFLFINLSVFVLWLLINTESISLVRPFDPYPFILLTTMVSLEAIILSIFVLISQNRASKIDDLRQEIDLQIDIITESEITKLLGLTSLLLQKNGIDPSKDKELKEMLEPINEEKIERSLERQIEKAENGN